MSEEAAAQSAAPAKSKTLLFILIAVLIVVGGGGGAYWFFAKPAEATGPEAKKPSEPPAIINFDPFVVNLADAGTPRFLRVTLGLVVEGEKPAKEFGENAVVRSQVRSSLLEMLSQQQASQLITPDGKAALKKAVIERAEKNAPELKVTDVLFTEFIVQ
jgi:flagellar FliL protein